MLRHFAIQSVKLMTNNPRKIEALNKLGLPAERVELITASTRFNERYLATKASKLGHLLTAAPAHAPVDHKTAEK